MFPRRRFWRLNPEDVAPRTELDSFLRDAFCRLVEQEGPVVIQMGEERYPGKVRWNMGVTPAGTPEVTFWFEPEKEFAPAYSNLRARLQLFKDLRTAV